jgi:ATP-dependent DNA ligase
MPSPELPTGPQWQYEPKWDGFRCLAFRDGGQIKLQSKSQKGLTRYFPDVSETLLALKARKFVLDGELVIPRGAGLSFDALLQRIHPAASRVRRLARETPAHLILFDLLVTEQGTALVDYPLLKRREELERFAAKFARESPGLHLSPATRDKRAALRWVEKSGNALDGLIAKRVDLPYDAGERNAARKIKFYKSADCVVGGFRFSTKGESVGSLLLGLYDDEGLLHHVGHCTVSAKLKPAELTRRLKALVEPPGFTGDAPGGPSRWATERSTEWQPVRPELVAEVQYDHLTGNRFRHGTKFLRWRPDKAPEQCTKEQLAPPARSPLYLLK